MDAKITYPAILISIPVLVVSGLYVAHNLYGQRILPPVFNYSAVSSTAQESNSGLPTRIAIPSINVNANIIYVGLTRDGAVDTPKGPKEAAWFKLGVKPGEKGSAVIVGHFGPWKNGAHSVFDNLDDLKKGDTVYVQDDKGQVLKFEVQETKMYDQGESPPEVFNKDDGIYLNLITCSGAWLANQKTYAKRLVVFTKKVE